MFETRQAQAQYEVECDADFALGGEVEFEELAEAEDDLESLVAGVRGARHAGA